ncbi:TPA: DUF551 domain-containing protein [Escherichia coli]|nr:DUF551 domain-containing protein [Escherichia coli]
MSTITKERIELFIKSPLENGLTRGEQMELARIALASLEAEAVCVIDQSNLDYLKSGSDADVWPASRTEMGDVLLYRAAPPAPVSVPECFKRLLHHAYGMTMGHDWNKGTMAGHHRAKLCQAVDECRAAMLQGADGKPELTVWYGSMPESNGKANWTAILHRKGEGRCMDGFTIDRSEYPGRVLYAADRVRYLIGEKSERPSILDYDADAHSGYVKPGNSPVIPDGWISCSEQMPSAGEQVLAYRPDAPESNDPLIKMATYVGGSAHGHGFDCYCKPTHWMPLPAAPQEVNRG